MLPGVFNDLLKEDGEEDSHTTFSFEIFQFIGILKMNTSGSRHFFQIF